MWLYINIIWLLPLIKYIIDSWIYTLKVDILTPLSSYMGDQPQAHVTLEV